MYHDHHQRQVNRLNNLIIIVSSCVCEWQWKEEILKHFIWSRVGGRRRRKRRLWWKNGDRIGKNNLISIHHMLYSFVKLSLPVSSSPSVHSDSNYYWIWFHDISMMVHRNMNTGPLIEWVEYLSLHFLLFLFIQVIQVNQEIHYNSFHSLRSALIISLILDCLLITLNYLLSP